MTSKPDPITPRIPITLQRQDGDGWRTYGWVSAMSRKVDDSTVAFTIEWATGIDRGHRVGANCKELRTILAIARMSATEQRPDLILTCRRVLEK